MVKLVTKYTNGVLENKMKGILEMSEKETLEEENKRLREALEEIKKTVESAQDTVYPLHISLDSKDGLYILEVTKEALKG